MSTDEKDLEIRAIGTQAQMAGDFLIPFASKREKAVQARVFLALEKGDAIDPAVAVSSWIEMYELHKLRGALRKSVEQGHRATLRIEERKD